MERLINKIALVTGASSGIGKAIAEQLVSNGLTVIGISRRVDKMKILAEEWKTKSGKFIPIQCDLSNQIEIIRTMETIEKNLGVIEILVNSAVIDLPTTLIDGSIDDWKKSLDINLLSVVILTQEMLKTLKRKGIDSGIIININDTSSLSSILRPVSSSYLVTKTALRNLTDNLRIELARLQSNIKVISIIPGLVDTELMEKTLREKPRLALKPKDVADAVLLTIQTAETVLIRDLVITPIRDITL